MMNYLIQKHYKIKKSLFLKKRTEKSKVIKLIVTVFLLFFIHIEAMIIFEHLNLMDAIWLTLTTATTVGYGDISATTVMGRLSTIILLFLIGLWVFAETIGSIVEYKTNKLKLKQTGNWSWKMKDHIVILNVPCRNETRYLLTLVEQFSQDDDFEFEDIIIVTSKFNDKGLPLSLQQKGIMLVNESPIFEESLDSSSIKFAKHIVIISDDENDNHSDSKTFDLVHKVRDKNKSGYLVAECCFESNKKRILDAGANAVIRPARAYPGMVVRALKTKGSECFIEDIMSTKGNQVNNINVSYNEITWGNIVVDSLPLGLAIGYENNIGEYIFNPDSKTIVTTKNIFLLSNKEK